MFLFLLIDYYFWSLFCPLLSFPKLGQAHIGQKKLSKERDEIMMMVCDCGGGQGVIVDSFTGRWFAKMKAIQWIQDGFVKKLLKC